MQFDITIWGARGSLPIAGPATGRFGGNTSCIELRIGGRIVIFDAGSGIEPLGRSLLQRGGPPVDIFLTHAHYDHVIGLPFFAPLHTQGARVTLHYAGCDAAPDGPALLDRLIAAPFLPFGPADFRADLTHAALPAPGSFMLGPDCAVETLRVNHPGGSLALKTRAGGRSFVYVPDFEHDDGPLDAALVAFLEGVDLAVLDCTFSPSEYPRMRGLGHSHWGRVAELVEAAGVAHWGAFHHAHTRTDEELDLLAQSLLRSGGGGFVVVEGMTFDLMAPGLAMGWPAPRAPA